MKEVAAPQIRLNNYGRPFEFLAYPGVRRRVVVVVCIRDLVFGAQKATDRTREQARSGFDHRHRLAGI